MSYLPAYKSLAANESDDELSTANVCSKSTFKKHIFRILVAVAIMYAAFSGIKQLSWSNLRIFRGCHGAQRNISSLPAHFTLPSGDTIPSVALGM